jgi:hypothetical protein
LIISTKQKSILQNKFNQLQLFNNVLCCFQDILKFLPKMGYLQFCLWPSLVNVLAITNIWWWLAFLLMPQFDNDSIIWLATFLIQAFKVFSFFRCDYDGVFGFFSSSIMVLSSSSFGFSPFYYTNLFWFALYLKIGKSYLLLFGSFSFSSHFLHEASTNEYFFCFAHPQ